MLQHRLATPIIQPRMYFFDKDKKPLTGGKVYSYKVGEDVFKPTYRNSELTAANQNPILLDSAGSALIYLHGTHRLKIYDKKGIFVEDRIVYQQQMRTQFFDKYGKALGGGKVWTYDYQSTIKKPSYENADDALLNPNPVILDENGYGSISMVGAYRLRQYDKKGVFVGDQDFKRPPARVLTSVVYPIYFEEGVILSSLVADTTQKQVVNENELIESVGLDISVVSANVRDPTNVYDSGIESTFTNCTLIEASREEYNPYRNTTMQPESVSTLTTVTSASLRAALITNIMELDNISSSCVLSGAQYTN